MQAADIASNLIQDDSFFEGTFVEVLREIAKDNHLPEPTRTLIHSIRDNLRCDVLRTQDPEVYMQCSIEEAKVFINEQVDPHPTPTQYYFGMPFITMKLFLCAVALEALC